MEKLIAQNKKARHDYFIDATYECGIVLKGTEIKSIRNNKVSINDCYGRIKSDGVYVINMNISKYEHGNIFNHDETRERKLLLNKREILKIKSMTEKEGYTLIPLKLYLKDGLAKLELGVCKGKKLYDKREDLKEQDMKRRIEKVMKNI